MAPIRISAPAEVFSLNLLSYPPFFLSISSLVEVSALYSNVSSAPPPPSHTAPISLKSVLERASSPIFSEKIHS